MPDEQIEVFVTSSEEADHEVAEFWIGDVQFGETLERDGGVVLRIEPRSDGQAWEVGAHQLYDSLARARELLSSF